MKRLGTIIMILLCAVVLALPSFAATGRGHKNMEGTPCEGPGDPSAISGLKLSADQLVKFNDLKRAHLQDIKPLMDKMFSLKGDLRLLWLEKNPDLAKINAVQKEIRSLRDQLEDKRTAHHLEILNILTPEQQIKLKALISRDYMGFRDGMGPRHGGHHQPSPRPCMQDK